MGQEVVLDDAPILGLILADDAVVVILGHSRPVDRLAVAQVESTLALHDIGGNPQSNPSVDDAVTMAVVLVIGVLDDDVVAEEARGLAGRVRDQRLLCGEFQLEVSRRNAPSRCLISSASAFGPANPRRQSSAYAECRVMPTPVGKGLTGQRDSGAQSA